jgi:hypothetical protein
MMSMITSKTQVQFAHMDFSSIRIVLASLGEHLVLFELVQHFPKAYVYIVSPNSDWRS